MLQRSQAELDERERCKARVKAVLLREPWLRPRIGRFELVSLLGQGATGMVYEARDTSDGAHVALKLLSHVDPRAIARFKREFRTLCEITHGNLVQLHELFMDSDRWFFTMELVRGVSFTRWTSSSASEDYGGDCDVSKLQHALRQLVLAVRVLHATGRVHCDLKPANVMVTETGRVVVLDFSLVALFDDALTTTSSASAGAGSSLRGTPEFMAPELFTGGTHSPKSDAYAVGVMLFHALHGALPSRSVADRAPALARDALLGDHVHAPALRRELTSLCNGLMQTDPLRRLSLEDVAARLGNPEVATPNDAMLATALFVGRAHELALLGAAFGASRQSGPVAVFVSGESGIGKSVLCDAFAETLRGRAVVLRGRCHEREALPYKAFDGVVDGLARHLRELPVEQLKALRPPHAGALLRMFPSLRGVGDWACDGDDALAREQTQLRQQAFLAFKILLERYAQRAPLVLIVDDLQWGDVDSAQLLRELLGPPDAPALLYVGCHRSRENRSSDFLEELFADATAARWQCQWQTTELGLMSPAEAGELAGSLLADSADAGAGASMVERIVAEAGGNPFLINELARHFTREREEGAMPSLASMFARCIASLDGRAQQILLLLAIAARPVRTEVLATALGSYDEAARALQLLMGTGLVRRARNAEWVIYHDAYRERACQLAEPQRASALHGALARAYEANGSAEPEWLVEHWRAAGDAVRALEYAVSAARAAAHNLAFNRAAALYQAALGLLNASDKRRASLQAELGEAFANAGRSAQAADAFLEAVACGHASATILRCRAAAQSFRSGRSQSGHALLEHLMRDVGVHYPKSNLGLYVNLLASRVRLSVRKLLPRAASPASTQPKSVVLEAVFREIMFLEPLRGALLLSLFHEEALRSGRREHLFVALAWETYAVAAQGGLKVQRKTARNIERLSQLSHELATPYAAGTVLMVQTAAAIYEFRISNVDAYARAAQQIFATQCSGAFWEESICDALHSTALETTGPLSILCQRAPVLLRRANERSDDFADAMLCRTVSLAYVAQDQPTAAILFLQQRLAMLDGGGNREFDLRRWLIIQSLVDCQSYAGQTQAAWETLESTWPEYLGSPFDRTEFIRTASHYRRGRLAAALAVRGAGTQTLRAAEHHERVLSRMRNRVAEGSAYLIRAALAAYRGELTDASRLLERAETACRETGLIIPAAAIRRQRGRIAASPHGRQLIEEADAALLRLGVANPARWADGFIVDFDAAQRETPLRRFRAS